MKKLLRLLILTGARLPIDLCAQTGGMAAGAETVERSAAKEQQSNPQLNRILRRLRQNQTLSIESAGYPDRKQIQHDLVGHSLAEGVSNGYRPADWSWTIEKGQIRSLRIVRELKKSKREYLFMAEMRLSNGYYAYDAEVKIHYIRNAQNQWKLDYVVSQGMEIVVTHEYDNCVSASIVDDGWGSTYCAQFVNRSEMSLVVGCDVLTNDGWKRFAVRLSPHSSGTAGGLFQGGSVSDYRINFIVRIN